MAEEVIGLMSPETEKEAGRKFKFKSKVAEIVDDPLIRIIDDKILQPLSLKLPPEIKQLVVEALAEVIAEMPEMEI